ncbi:MAG TPA: serine/threonine-protein kinase [Polyangiaceae bacterium]
MDQLDRPLQRADTFIGRTIASEVHADVVYRVSRLLGQGATARAYFALRLTPYGQTPVAIKIILPRIAQTSSSVGDLVIQKEAVALGRLNERIPRCPNVVRFIDTGVVNTDYAGYALPLPWLALEFVDGGTEGTLLEDRIIYSVKHTGYAFDSARAGRTIDGMARGLDEIHAVGVLHRDLKPTNVLSCGGGDTEICKIADFGFARPMGLSATFGAIAVGTPGYTAPEQMLADRGSIGPEADVFALAAVTYFVLTGEDYFKSDTAPEAYQEFRVKQRRSLADAKGLCPELRERPTALRAMDQALARATAFHADARPHSAGEFAESMLPWLDRAPGSVHLSERWLESIRSASPISSDAKSNWIVRYPPGDDRLIIGAAWNAGGHCLAATTNGLEYFDGVYWSKLPEPPVLAGYRALHVKRHSPTTWLVTTTRSRVVEVAREGTRVLTDGREADVDFLDVDGDIEDLAVAIGEARGRAPLICTKVGHHWLRSLELKEVAHLSGVARIDATRWLLTGRDHGGRAWSGIHHPLDMRVTSLPVPESRALVACASRRGRSLAVAVGSAGLVLCYDGDRAVTSTTTLPGSSDLSAVAIDVAASIWVASVGQLVTFKSPANQFVNAWQNPSWEVPFISLHAELGHLFALTVDGAVLEGRIQAL